MLKQNLGPQAQQQSQRSIGATEFSHRLTRVAQGVMVGARAVFRNRSKLGTKDPAEMVLCHRQIAVHEYLQMALWWRSALTQFRKLWCSALKNSILRRVHCKGSRDHTWHECEDDSQMRVHPPKSQAHIGGSKGIMRCAGFLKGGSGVRVPSETCGEDG